MDSKIIYGQAWIQGNSLVQEQTMIVPGVDSFNNTVVLIDNIWENLLGKGREWSGGEETTTDTYYYDKKKKYFFWCYKMTDLDNDDHQSVVKIECPRPKEGLFDKFYDNRMYDTYDIDKVVNSEYAYYWVDKLKTAAINSSQKSVIQVKEISFCGTENVIAPGSGKHYSAGYSDLTKETDDLCEMPPYRETNDEIGDITNLLGLF